MMENYNNISTEELIRIAKKDVDAQAVLAVRLAMGIGAQKNAGDALDWAEKAYSKGRTDMAPLIAKLYFEGEPGVKKDVDKAFKYYTIGANARNIECMCKLATEYYSGNNGQDKDDKKAFELVHGAVSVNDADEESQGLARYHMGNMYYYGIGVEHNVAEAVNWYLKALAKGCEDAYVGIMLCCKEQNAPDEMKYYAQKACVSESATIREKGVEFYNEAVRTMAKQREFKGLKLSDYANGLDRDIHEIIRRLQENTSKYPGFDAEANRLEKNAQTFARIGNYKRVYPTYEHMAEEYPHDFRGWYNLARVFTDNFAVYSVFSVEDYGKIDKPEYCENMTYAQRTVEEYFSADLAGIIQRYRVGCVDISIEELKNTLYSFYYSENAQVSAAKYIRQYEEKLTYLYNNKPCVVTALALHVLLNILNNDNIDKYNDRVRKHNTTLDDKVNQKVDDYIIELAQRMRIEHPKDYANNDEAMEDIKRDKEIQAEIRAFREHKRAELEYYIEIHNLISSDVYDEHAFGEDRQYQGYKPAKAWEYDDSFVDFIVALAEKCGIHMRGYEAFYSPERLEKYNEFNSVLAKRDSVRLEYFDRFVSLRAKYSLLAEAEEASFGELAAVAGEYREIFEAYEKANNANVFKQVFKGKELKEDQADINQAYEIVSEKLNSVMEKVLELAKHDVAAINASVREKYPDVADSVIIYDDSDIDVLISRTFDNIKNNR